MDILSGVISLLQLAEAFFSVRARIDKRSEIADLLHTIGTLIESVATDLQNNVYPENKCAQMQQHFRSIIDVLKRHFSSRELVIIRKNLGDACNVERMFGEFGLLGEQNKQKNIAELQKVSGTFIALSDIVRAK